jgi:ribonuclease-3
MVTNMGQIDQEAPFDLAVRLGLDFKGDLRLLERALTHRSYVNEHPESIEDNERLEFLGDAVLDFVVGAYLYNHYPELAEGNLTRMRSVLVDTQQLARFAIKIELGNALRLGHGELQAGGKEKPPLLCDAFEALIGAIYLNGGIKEVIRFFQPLLKEKCLELTDSQKIHDPKSELQEWSQSRGWFTPVYKTKSVSGPDHAKVFEVEVLINAEIYGLGIGRSKQIATKNAAKQALERIESTHIKLLQEL